MRNCPSFLPPEGQHTDYLPFNDFIATRETETGRITKPTHLGEWYTVFLTLVPDPYSLIPLFIYPFIQRVFIEHLLCTREWPGHWGYRSEQVTHRQDLVGFLTPLRQSQEPVDLCPLVPKSH